MIAQNSHIKISIVLPSYNRENYIAFAIESCLSQSFKEFELIIVDDASQDNSVSIIKSYMNQDSRIKLIQNESNKKLPASLNLGFSLAKGEYLT
jgi:glycosyltransferase involved in cell wall biosynthesis